MLEFMEVPLPGRKGSLTLLSFIRRIIGTLIRALWEIRIAAPSEDQSFSSAITNLAVYSTFYRPLRVKTWWLMTRKYTDFRKNRAQIQKSWGVRSGVKLRLQTYSVRSTIKHVYRSIVAL